MATPIHATAEPSAIRRSSFLHVAHGDEPATERAEDRIRVTYQRLAAAWSAGDAAAVGALLDRDCDHVSLGRTRQTKKGRAELLESWTQAFARRCADFSVRMHTTIYEVRLLSRDVAIVDGDFDYSSGVGATGCAQSKCFQPFTAVMTLRGDEWLVSSIRATAAVPVHRSLSSVD